MLPQNHANKNKHGAYRQHIEKTSGKVIGLMIPKKEPHGPQSFAAAYQVTKLFFPGRIDRMRTCADRYSSLARCRSSFGSIWHLRLR
jgi:hypothetical protein